MEDNRFRVENIIKSRMSEALIESLFQDLGFLVNKFSVKHTVPKLYSLLEGVDKDTSQHIKLMPDFMVQHPKTREVFFIEVKFRTSETFRFSELKDYPYKNCMFIIISQQTIRCISYEELKKEGKIDENSNYYLQDRKKFLTFMDSNYKMSKYCEYAKKSFQNL